MDKMIKDILSLKFDKKQIDKIVKFKNEYIISLSENGEPVMDEFYSYKNGEINPYVPTADYLKSKNIVYDGGDKK